MATPTVEEVLVDDDSGASASVATAAGTAEGDLLVAIGVSDFYALADFDPPTPGTWTLVESVGPDDNTHMRVWRRFVTSAGANTVTLAPINDEDVGLYVYRLSGADGTAPVDDSDSTNGSPASTSHVAPSVSPASSDALLICAWATGNGSYTDIPEGMTARTAIDGAPFYEAQAADEVLASSGATGTRTATFDASRIWVAASVAVQGASAGTTHDATVTVAAAGAASATASRETSATVAAAATGATSNAPTADRQAAAITAATGQATAAGTRDLTATSTSQATGGLSAAALRGLQATATAAATGALSGSATLDLAGTATVVGAGALQVVGEGGGDASTTVAAAGGLSAAGTVTRSAAATLAGSGGLTVTGPRIAVAAGTLAAAASTSAAASVARAASVTVASAATLAALADDPALPGTVALVATAGATAGPVAGLTPSATVAPPRVPTAGGVA